MELLEAFPRLISWAIPVIILAVIIFPQAIRILREYERGVIFRLGKLLGAKGPGVIFLIPIVDRMVRMDLRVVTISVERQEVMTRDNVPVTVDAVVYFRVVDPQSAVVKVENFLKATSLIAADDAAERARPGPLGRPAFAARVDQPEVAGDHRSANRTVGSQSHGGRGEGRCAARHHEACDGQASRSRARAPREDRQCRGRISGCGKNGAGRGDDEQGTDRSATAFPANDARNFQRT